MEPPFTRLIRNTLLGVAIGLGLCGGIVYHTKVPLPQDELLPPEDQYHHEGNQRRLVASHLQLSRYGESAKSLLEEKRPQDEFTSLRDEFERLLEEQDDDITALAEERWREHQCRSLLEYSGQKPLYGERLKREEILERIFQSADRLEYKPSRANNAQSVSDLQQMIEDLKNNSLGNPGEQYQNPAYHLALARSYEPCIAEGQGLADMYRDFSHEFYEGNCEETENLAHSMGDRNRELLAVRQCLTPLDRQNPHLAEEKNQRFYTLLEQLPEEELLPAADRDILGTSRADRQRWLSICQNIREDRGVSERQAYASCVADITIRDAGREGGIYGPQHLGLPESEVVRLIDYLPQDEHIRERQCVLQAPLRERQREDESEQTGRPSDWREDDAWSIYERCLERG